MYMFQMSQVLVNGSQGCITFTEITGRKVRNRDGIQGEDPSSLGGIQPITYGYDTCAICTPPPLNGIAIKGTGLVTTFTPGTFGRYECTGQVGNPMDP
jgi:hypothetical protein